MCTPYKKVVGVAPPPGEVPFLNAPDGDGFPVSNWESSGSAVWHFAFYSVPFLQGCVTVGLSWTLSGAAGTKGNQLFPAWGSSFPQKPAQPNSSHPHPRHTCIPFTQGCNCMYLIEISLAWFDFFQAPPHPDLQRCHVWCSLVLDGGWPGVHLPGEPPGTFLSCAASGRCFTPVISCQGCGGVLRVPQVGEWYL